jgi:predicted metal-dependent HD superfamily phosphohydrolase
MNRRLNAKAAAAMRDRFVTAWRRLGACYVPDFSDIVARYSESHRAYHTLEHLLGCLRWLAVGQGLAERPLEVELALFYHDVVYAPLRIDNEKRSAELFLAHAQASHLPAGPTARIVVLIEGTALHRAHDADGALLNDIDLAVLGSSPRQFARYEEQIREEHGQVDERVFRTGREQILKSFLDATSIYGTQFFSQRLVALARANLSRSLLALRHAPAVEQP